MYNVTIVKSNKSNVREEDTFPCDHYSSKTIPEDCVAALDPTIRAIPGITVELTLTGKGIYKTFRLPEDGNDIFITGENGRTVNSFHWPLRDNKEKEFRAGQG